VEMEITVSRFTRLIPAIALLCSACAPQPPEPQPAGGDITERLEKADAFLRSQVAEGFSGVALVAVDDRILLQKAYAPAGSGIDPETAFWIASITKPFTAAAVVKLAEDGELSLDDPLEKFFDGVPEDKRGITIRQMLSHSAGLGDGHGADGVVDRGQAVEALLAEPLVAPVGAGYRYSDDAYNLLAAIIEVASKQSYESYLQRHVLDPALLQHCGFWGQAQTSGLELAGLPDAAVATSTETFFRDGVPYASYGSRGSTGLACSADDLYHWVTVLRAGGIVSAQSVQQIFSPVILARHSPDGDVYYGLGWVVVMHDGQLVEFRHSGAEDFLGHSAIVRVRGNNVVVVMSNGDRDGVEWAPDVAGTLVELLEF
jgi:CubicO group peptidase (beta-lactamase class C family)